MCGGRTILLTFAFCLLTFDFAFPQPQFLTYRSPLDGTDQPYALYLPKALGARTPLVVALHGEESNQRLMLRRVFGRGNRPGETDLEATRFIPRLPEVDFIVACPFIRGGWEYVGFAENELEAMLAEVYRRYAIDEDRVYLTGVSKGASGALWLALTHPDRWAAVAFVCPLPSPAAEALASNAGPLSFRLFHGEDDRYVPAASSRAWHKRLVDQGTPVEYIEYPDVRHNAWDLAFRDAQIFEWFARHTRERRPERVRFLRASYRYASAWWVKLDALRPGTLAWIDARSTGENRLEVTTRDLDAFTLNLSPLTLVVDGAALRPKQQPSLTKVQGQWKLTHFTPQPGAKRTGLEGPLEAAVAARHVYIYGSGREDLRQQAQEAARWSTPRVRLSVALRILSDLEEPGEANMILFGNRENNRAIARLAPRLPLELNPSAADYGLVFIYPVDGRYVVVNSGLKWWAGAEPAEPPFRTLSRFGDFALFKGSIENIVCEGRFDANWKLPPAKAAEMAATGAVTVREVSVVH